ncbi:TetR/AcrR family transcriptional regulator [Kribbella sp. CA-253562]|uniref:TetR/AcrR family transcriptional regulator n=1 Tax=Kribbella sp. CA-253562 TaxID=3239942 RepID=UPI003D8C7EFA
MGNREALIEGAKLCLRDNGYTRTTARDIAGAAGVSLAAIGYHFGSKDALLNEAMRQALREWSDELGRTMSAGPNAAAAPQDRFAATWASVIDTLSDPVSRALWTTQFEVLSQGSQLPDLLQAVATLQGEARENLAALFGVADDDSDEVSAQRVGSFLQALLLGVVALTMFDPERAPRGEDIAASVQLIAAKLAR